MVEGERKAEQKGLKGRKKQRKGGEAGGSEGK